MSNRNYLNSILTINAVLLGVLVWMQFAGSTTAQTASAVEEPPALASTVPNAATQRAEMIALLRDIKKASDANQNYMRSGKLRVEVSNLDDIKFPTK